MIIQDIKIIMKTEPLDVVYNEKIVDKVKQFFVPRSTKQLNKEMSEIHLTGLSLPGLNNNLLG